MKRHRLLVRTVIPAVALLFSVGADGLEAAPRAAANAAYQTYLPAVLREVSRDVSVPTLLAPPDESTVSTPVVTLQWAAVAGASRYYLYWREAGQYAWHGSWVDATSHVITNLAPSTTYEWRLRAFSLRDNPGPLSEIWSFVTAAELVLPAPALLAPPDGSTVSTLEVTVQWAAVAGASRYYLYWREAGQYAWHGTWVDGTSRVITSLVPSTTYEWRVRVHGDGQLGGLSETWSFVTAAELVLPAPALLAPPDGSTVTSLEVTVRWAAVSGAARYYLYWRDAAQGVWRGTLVYGTTRTIVNLAPSTTYEWRVRALTAGDSPSPLSDTWLFTTPAP